MSEQLPTGNDDSLHFLPRLCQYRVSRVALSRAVSWYNWANGLPLVNLAMCVGEGTVHTAGRMAEPWLNYIPVNAVDKLACKQLDRVEAMAVTIQGTAASVVDKTHRYQMRTFECLETIRKEMVCRVVKRLEGTCIQVTVERTYLRTNENVLEPLKNKTRELVKTYSQLQSCVVDRIWAVDWTKTALYGTEHLVPMQAAGRQFRADLNRRMSLTLVHLDGWLDNYLPPEVVCPHHRFTRREDEVCARLHRLARRVWRYTVYHNLLPVTVCVVAVSRCSRAWLANDWCRVQAMLSSYACLLSDRYEAFKMDLKYNPVSAVYHWSLGAALQRILAVLAEIQKAWLLIWERSGRQEKRWSPLTRCNHPPKARHERTFQQILDSMEIIESPLESEEDELSPDVEQPCANVEEHLSYSPQF